MALTFDDIDWESRELIVRAHKAKGQRERSIPIDDSLWDILKRQEAERADRKPSTRTICSRVLSERFSTRHVLVSRECTPINRRSVYDVLLRCCGKAGITVETFDGEGLPLEHVDVHSLRRTFATDLIVNGTDPPTVQELLGHKTLAMTMKLYAKVRPQNKRQAVARLSCGKGVSAPGRVLEYPGASAIPADPVRPGHQSVTTSKVQA
jgi:integrase